MNLVTYFEAGRIEAIFKFVCHGESTLQPLQNVWSFGSVLYRTQKGSSNLVQFESEKLALSYHYAIETMGMGRWLTA